MSSGDLPLAFYGTLRPGGGALEALGIEPKMRWIGSCLLSGVLYDMGRFPALTEGTGTVTGDLFAHPDAGTLAVIDAWERFDSTNPDESWYLRKRVRLLEPDRDAIVYVWNCPLGDAAPVPGGDWLDWRDRHG